MEKEFIPYEQALALKELGFNEPCFGYYDGNHNLQFMYNGIPEKFSEKMMGVSASVWVGWISAPLYQQAFRWFREKHGLISYIHPLALLENDGLWCYEITNFSNNWDESFDLHSPEEAELECLKKLIEIVKEKK